MFRIDPLLETQGCDSEAANQNRAAQECFCSFTTCVQRYECSCLYRLSLKKTVTAVTALENHRCTNNMVRFNTSDHGHNMCSTPPPPQYQSPGGPSRLFRRTVPQRYLHSAATRRAGRHRRSRACGFNRLLCGVSRSTMVSSLDRSGAGALCPQVQRKTTASHSTANGAATRSIHRSPWQLWQHRVGF